MIEEFQIVEGKGFEDLDRRIKHQEMRGWWRKGANVIHSSNGIRSYLQGMARSHRLIGAVTCHLEDTTDLTGERCAKMPTRLGEARAMDHYPQM